MPSFSHLNYGVNKKHRNLHEYLFLFAWFIKLLINTFTEFSLFTWIFYKKRITPMYYFSFNSNVYFKSSFFLHLIKQFLRNAFDSTSPRGETNQVICLKIFNGRGIAACGPKLLEWMFLLFFTLSGFFMIIFHSLQLSTSSPLTQIESASKT